MRENGEHWVPPCSATTSRTDRAQGVLHMMAVTVDRGTIQPFEAAHCTLSAWGYHLTVELMHTMSSTHEDVT